LGTASGSNFAESHGYDYDATNRLASYTNTNVFDDASFEYGYDNRGQLTSTGELAYEYDDNGNFVRSWSTELVGLETDYTTGDLNRLVEHDYVSGWTFNYGYDNEGNRTLRFLDTNADDQWSSNEYGTIYTWDHRNRLTNVTVKQGPSGTATWTIDYEYDAFNQLINRTLDPDGAGTGAAIDQTFYLYEQDQMSLEFHKTGSGNLAATDLSHRYLWGPAVDQLLADEQVDWNDSDADGPVYWALTDHLGSVRDVVDSNGDLRIHREFDSFGKIVDETHYNGSGAVVTAGQAGYVDEAFAFTGRYFDADTGLQNNLNRWYDPSVGRWLSEDPIGFAAGDVNLYRYVGNSSTMRTDPNGLFPPESVWDRRLGIGPEFQNSSNAFQRAADRTNGCIRVKRPHLGSMKEIGFIWTGNGIKQVPEPLLFSPAANPKLTKLLAGLRG
jgi:RHS repeat-associated protein